MFEVCSEIEIPAPPRQVWRALVDFPGYQNWNPYVQIRGVAGNGSKIEWSLGSTVLKRRIWTTALITQFDEPVALAWSFGSRRVFAVEERFSLEGSAIGTRLQHKAKCMGVASILGGGRIRKKIQEIVATADKSLCRYFERRAKSPKPVAPGAPAARVQKSKTRRQTRKRHR